MATMGSKAVVEAFPFSNISITAAPFLYQTRTLSNLAPVRASATHRARYQRTFGRIFSCINRVQYSIDHGHSRTNSKSGNRGSFTIKRTTNMHGSAPVALGRWEFNPNPGSEDQSGGVPIRRSSCPENNSQDRVTTSRHIGTVTSRRKPNMEGNDDIDFSKLEAIDFNEGTDEELCPGKDEIADLTRSHQGRESTITDSERYAFQKIFTDIFGRNRHSDVSLRDDVDDDLDHRVAKSVDMEKVKSKLDSIFSSAIQTQPKTRQEMESMVNKYPPALRAAAAKAIGLAEAEAEDEENAPLEGKSLNMEHLETLREPERTRVENSLMAAKTDFELWEVMEKEVFSLIPKLGLEDTSKPAEEVPTQSSKEDNGLPKKKRPNKSQKVEPAEEADQTAVEVSNPTNSVTISEDGISPLALYGPLYPSYLLLGLRLLDRSFAKPSPLTLSVLPKIKSLGLISHVLGASTQLYNELLRIHRYRYDDYRSILNLLSEMENSGLELDQETLETVVDIQRTQHSVRRGAKGPAIQALWSLPEFAPDKFKIWREKIRLAVSEKAQNRLRY